jgi:bifunctional non-homologous end joining protein LigD
VEFPVAVALAELVPQLPTGPGWRYEVKMDGHRTIMWRLPETVRLQARSGRDVTAVWMDLALAGMDLPAGVVLDGEAVVVVEGKISFEAAQSRAASSPARARRLAEQYPALFIVWDVLQLPGGQDVRARPYEWRRAALLDVLAGLPGPFADSGGIGHGRHGGGAGLVRVAGADRSRGRGRQAGDVAIPGGPARRRGRRSGTPRRSTPR